MQIFRFDELPSTQDKTLDLLQQGVSAPFFVVTDRQTRGRGRMNREWISEPGRSLTMSIGLEMPARQLEGLSLVMGLVVRDAIGLEALRLKWPNDLMLEDNKVGGILIESRSQSSRAQIAVGLGINLRALHSASYQGIGRDVDLEKLSRSLETRMPSFLDHGFVSFRAEFESVLWHKGQRVVLQIDEKKKDVLIVGVSERGWLKTNSNGEFQLSDQGEIVAASNK